MNREDKGNLYDEYLRQGDVLLRENSKIKSENPINMPEDKQKIINANEVKVKQLQVKLENLFN